MEKRVVISGLTPRPVWPANWGGVTVTESISFAATEFYSADETRKATSSAPSLPIVLLSLLFLLLFVHAQSDWEIAKFVVVLSKFYNDHRSMTFYKLCISNICAFIYKNEKLIHYIFNNIKLLSRWYHLTFGWKKECFLRNYLTFELGIWNCQLKRFLYIVNHKNLCKTYKKAIFLIGIKSYKIWLQNWCVLYQNNWELFYYCFMKIY